MKKLFPLLLLLAGLLSQAQHTTPELVKKQEGFTHPESVVYNEKRDQFYISNIGEEETGDGFISLLDSEGEVVEINWIAGLNDPKGLLVQEDKLYVTDVTEFVEMDIETGEIAQRIPVEGAEFLNDVTADNDGNIYISDMRNSSIYIKEASSDEVKLWHQNDELDSPNGLLAVGDHIYIAAWGEDEGGNLLKINIASKEINTVSESPIGNMDGIQLNEDNNFYISDWATGDIHEIGTNGKIRPILTSEKSAGDILFRSETGQLVLPMNHQNEVWWYQLK